MPNMKTMTTTILLWLKSLKTTTKIILVCVLLMIGISIYYSIKIYLIQRQQNKFLKSQIELVENRNKQLLSDFNTISEQRDRMEVLTLKMITEYNLLKDQLNTSQNETNKIPSIVRNYPDRKLDSILSNHKHISREYKRFVKGTEN